MARMQKKRPVHLKKKTPGDGDSASDNLQADSTATPVRSIDAATGESKEKKQKPVLSISKRTVGEQTALMKLIDRYFGKWIEFLREVWVELKRVAWPSRKETIGTTAVVIAFVFILSLFLGAIDVSLSSLIRLIL